MADASDTDKRDPKKAFIWGLKGEVTEDLLRKVMEPAAKGDQIVSVAIVPDKAPKFKGKMMAFIACQDEATAAAIIDLLKGEKMPEIAEGEVGAALAYDNRKPERTPRPRLTGDEVNDIVAALDHNPHFVEKCRGKPGERGEKGEKGERGEKGEKGEKGERGEKGDPGQRGNPGTPGAKGDPGTDGKDAPKAAWILCLILATLALLIVLGHAYCGSQDTQGEQGIQGQVGPRGQQGLEGPAGPQGPKGDSAPVTAVEEAVSAKPEPAPAPEPTAVAPAPEPTVPHAVGAIVVRDRFDRVEVRLDQVEQKLHEHFCDGSGPRDQERCAATR
jgi:hypothetical protein